LQQAELRARVVSRIPQGDVGSVLDVAHAVEFLASPQAGYLNGSTLVVDGAYSSI
jgi:acetoacetyl-CoA reductase